MNPNPGFKKQLAAFEEVLRTRGHYDTPVIEEIVDIPKKESSSSIDNDSTRVNGSADLNGVVDASKMNGSETTTKHSGDKINNDVNSNNNKDHNNNDINDNNKSAELNVSSDTSTAHSNSHAVVDEQAV